MEPAPPAAQDDSSQLLAHTHLRGIFFSSFMNRSFTLEKTSSSLLVPDPARLVVLAPAATEEAVADSGAAAASASLRLSLMVAMLGRPGRCCRRGEKPGG